MKLLGAVILYIIAVLFLAICIAVAISVGIIAGYAHLEKKDD